MTTGHEEFAMGAIASGDVEVINDDVVRGLGIAPEAWRGDDLPTRPLVS